MVNGLTHTCNAFAVRVSKCRFAVLQFGESSKSPEEADRESESGIVLRELDCKREDLATIQD